jgi:hypothetical protein
MRDTLFATFSTPHDAEQALGALLDHGVDCQDISIVLNDADRARFDNDHMKTGADIRGTAEHGLTTTTPGDAASGAAKGAGIGLGIGALAAIAAVTLPGIGVILGGGALATALAGVAGATAAGAVAGGSFGYLKDQGVPAESVDFYHNTVKGGGALVSVSVPSGNVKEMEVRDIMSKYASRAVEMFPVAADISREPLGRSM